MKTEALFFSPAEILACCCEGQKYPAACRDMLRYIPSGKIGYSKIAKNALLIPDSIALMVSPLGCARHCACNASLAGDGERFFSLALEERDIVTGAFFDKVEDAIGEILASLGPKPKHLSLITTCIDALLGADYESQALLWQQKFGMRVARLSMNPVLEDSAHPHKVTTIQAIYNTIPQRPHLPKNKLVNILGRVSGAPPGSELHAVLREAGGYTLRHITGCATLDEFDEMGQAALNVAIPIGEKACRDLEKRHGAPYVVVRPSYDLDVVADNCRRILSALGADADWRPHRDRARAAVEQAVERYGALRGAVGENIDDNPLVMAQDLRKAGFAIKKAFIEKIQRNDEKALSWLAQYAPDMEIYISAYPGMQGFSLTRQDTDYTVGLGYSYYYRDPSLPAVSVAEQPFDFYGVEQLVAGLDAAMRPKTKPAAEEAPLNQKQWGLYGKGVWREESV
jgi:nitrogenase molybdenum-cofactor synthesis protein NifE